MANKDAVLVGVIIGAHGIRGEVRIQSFTQDPISLASYRDVRFASGEALVIERHRLQKNVLVAKLRGVNDRNQSEGLKGRELFVDRASLPPPDLDDYYHADLIGCMAVDPDGNELGVLRAIYDFGAGDVLDISGEFIPFTREAVPNIDLEMRQILVVLPDYIEAAGDGQSPDPIENGSKLSANAKDSSQESEE